jgi:hypothetical protein
VIVRATPQASMQNILAAKYKPVPDGSHITALYGYDGDQVGRCSLMGMLFDLGFETATAIAVLTYRVHGSISNRRVGTQLTILCVPAHRLPMCSAGIKRHPCDRNRPWTPSLRVDLNSSGRLWVLIIATFL